MRVSKKEFIKKSEYQGIKAVHATAEWDMLTRSMRLILVDRSELSKHIKKLDWRIRNPELVHLTEKNVEHYKGKKRAFEEILEGRGREG